MPIGKIAVLNETAKRLDKILSDGDYGLELAQLDLDKAALADLQLHLDRYCSVDSGDAVWGNFQTLGDVVNWYLNAMNDRKIKRQYRQVVNMPQMALTGLSESWLFKEMGDCHWHMLCEDLGLKSNEIFDEFRNRLYATFVRIRFESTTSLKQYQENDEVDITGRIRRFGNSLYFGQVDLEGSGKEMHCSLVTTFSTRDSDCNHKLTKGVPSTGDSNPVVSVAEMPKLVTDYVKIKKGSVKTVELGGHAFEVSDQALFERSYTINPYTDINGVGLLYFAAYPLINDVCELEFFNSERMSGSHWALASSTVMRDICYFANCNIDDVITYRLNSYHLIANNRIAIQSSLVRDSDNTVMARVFTIKQLES